MTSTVLKYLEFILYYLSALFFCIFLQILHVDVKSKHWLGQNSCNLYFAIFQFFCRQRLHYVSDAAGAAAISAINIKEALDLIYKGINFFLNNTFLDIFFYVPRYLKFDLLF